MEIRAFHDDVHQGYYLLVRDAVYLLDRYHAHGMIKKRDGQFFWNVG